MNIADREVCLIVVEGCATGCDSLQQAAALKAGGAELVEVNGGLVAIDEAVVAQLMHHVPTAPLIAAPPPQPIAPPAAVAMKPVPPDRQAMTLTEAAKVIGCCKRTLERERDSGEIRCFRIGNRWKVSVSEINAYIRRQEKA